MIYNKKVMDEIPTFTPNCQRSLSNGMKRNKSLSSIEACSRLYLDAQEHQRNVDRKSQERLNECTHSPFINENSRQIESSLQPKRGPKYPKSCERHGAPESGAKPSKKMQPADMEEWLQRNYVDTTNERRAAEEERLNRPKHLESETSFIPKISESSKNMVDGRSDGDIHTTLFQEAKILKSRKQTKIDEKEKAN